jgi:hypothetical protein
MMKVEGTVPDTFFEWFETKYKKAKGKEKDMLSKIDIWEMD